MTPHLKKDDVLRWFIFFIVAILLPIIGFVYAGNKLFSKQILEQIIAPGDEHYWGASQYRYAVQRLQAEVNAYLLGVENFDDLSIAHDVLQSKYLVLTSSVSPQLNKIPAYADLLSKISIFMDQIAHLFQRAPHDPEAIKLIHMHATAMQSVMSDLIMIVHDEEVRLRDVAIDQAMFRDLELIALAASWAILAIFLARELIRTKRQQDIIAATKMAHEEALQTALARTTLLSTVSHEILTPLHTIQGGMELLTEMIKESRARRTMTNIQTATSYLSSLMQDLLDMSKLDAGKLVLRPTIFDLRPWISHIVGEYQPAAQAKGIALYLDVTQSVSNRIIADPVRIRQIVNNLVSNAIRYTDHGEIYVDLDQTQGISTKIIFTVTDTGIGIPLDERDSLFEPFMQGKSSNRGGSGMGLAIVSKLTALMGGKVELLQSVEGNGSTFQVEIPVEVIDDEDHCGVQLPPAAKRRRKILLVEDDDSLRNMLVDALGHYEFCCETSHTGADAMLKLAEHVYEATVLDIRLPDRHGLDLLDNLRKSNSANKNIPVIGITAFGANFQDKRSNLLTEKLGKPFSNRILAEKLLNCLHRL